MADDPTNPPTYQKPDRTDVEMAANWCIDWLCSSHKKATLPPKVSAMVNLTADFLSDLEGLLERMPTDDWPA